MDQDGCIVVPPPPRSYGTHQLRPAPVCLSPSKSSVHHKKEREPKASGPSTGALRGATGENRPPAIIFFFCRCVPLIPALYRFSSPWAERYGNTRRDIACSDVGRVTVRPP
eukprot:1177053-Prorocentrum_minimum.AAC.4